MSEWDEEGDKELTRSEQFLTIKQEMILAFAIGVEEPERVAARYGFEGDTYEALITYKPFTDAVEAKRSELQQSGYTFRMKAAMCAEDLLQEVYLKAKHPDAGFNAKMDALKTFTRLGDLEVNKNQVDTTAGFSINIVMGNGQEVSIGHTVQREAIDHDDLPALPIYEAQSLNGDLEANLEGLHDYTY